MKSEEGEAWDGTGEVMQGLVECEKHAELYFTGNLMPWKDFKYEMEVIIFAC